jgi:Zn-dependent M16 (insulinase) family peptidase
MLAFCSQDEFDFSEEKQERRVNRMKKGSKRLTKEDRKKIVKQRRILKNKEGFRDEEHDGEYI